MTAEIYPDAITGAFGCVFNMWSSEHFGRKRSIQIGCCISIVGATIMTASVDVGMFIASRFIMGINPVLRRKKYN